MGSRSQSREEYLRPWIWSGIQAEGKEAVIAGGGREAVGEELAELQCGLRYYRDVVAAKVQEARSGTEEAVVVYAAAKPEVGEHDGGEDEGVTGVETGGEGAVAVAGRGGSAGGGPAAARTEGGAVGGGA